MNFNRLLYHQFNAIYAWMQEENFIPEIIVNTKHPDVKLPEYLKANDRCVINIDMSAVTLMCISTDYISFNARFGGKSFACYIPMRAIEGFVSRTIKAKYGDIVLGLPQYPADDTVLKPDTSKSEVEATPKPATDTSSSAGVINLSDRRKR